MQTAQTRRHARPRRHEPHLHSSARFRALQIRRAARFSQLLRGAGRLQDDQGPKAQWSNAFREPWVYEGTPEQAREKIKFQIKRMGGRVVRTGERPRHRVLRTARAAEPRALTRSRAMHLTPATPRPLPLTLRHPRLRRGRIHSRGVPRAEHPGAARRGREPRRSQNRLAPSAQSNLLERNGAPRGGGRGVGHAKHVAALKPPTVHEAFRPCVFFVVGGRRRVPRVPGRHARAVPLRAVPPAPLQASEGPGSALLPKRCDPRALSCRRDSSSFGKGLAG